MVAKWQQGDERSFDVLYGRHILILLEVLKQKTGCIETARELAQDVFLAVYLQKEKLTEIVNFKAYLLSIAKHKVFNHYRRKLIHEKYQQHVTHQLSVNTESSTDEILENKELTRIISDKIEKLPPKCREIFRLSREEQLPYKKIAYKMAISENTVDQHIRKALRIIRSALKDYNSSITIGLLFLFI